uniref:Uncharacterized protein n=1 Tax=Timema poppense TaxID=170557 RepID=A0A7R9DQ10_TIMPO|nr:unnamed protein product [Timema poppensis]
MVPSSRGSSWERTYVVFYRGFVFKVGNTTGPKYPEAGSDPRWYFIEDVFSGLATQLVRSSPKLGVTPGGILSRMCFQGWQHDWSEVARSWERPQVVFYRGCVFRVGNTTGLATQLVRSSLKLGAGLGFRAAKADSTGPVSASVGQRAGLQTVFTLPYQDYKVNNKVVFEGASGGLTVLAARLRNFPPYVLPVSGDKSQL